MSLNTSSAWEAVKSYLTNFTHGLDAEIATLDAALLKPEAPAPKAKAPKVTEVTPEIEAPKS